MNNMQVFFLSFFLLSSMSLYQSRSKTPLDGQNKFTCSISSRLPSREECSFGVTTSNLVVFTLRSVIHHYTLSSVYVSSRGHPDLPVWWAEECRWRGALPTYAPRAPSSVGTSHHSRQAVINFLTWCQCDSNLSSFLTIPLPSTPTPIC